MKDLYKLIVPYTLIAGGIVFGLMNHPGLSLSFLATAFLTYLMVVD